MIWQGQALIIAIDKFSESSLIISFLSPDKGLVKALVKGGQNIKNRANYQLGNLLSFTFKARSEDQLGSISAVSLVDNFSAKFLVNKRKLLALKTILELIYLAVKSAEEYPRLYILTIDFFERMKSSDLSLEDYICYELEFLKEIGYGLNLDCCVVSKKKIIFFMFRRAQLLRLIMKLVSNIMINYYCCPNF